MMNSLKIKAACISLLIMLIQLSPTLVFGQTEPPLLILSNTGAGGLEGMKLELNDQTLMNPGPTITFEAPSSMIPGSGRIGILVDDDYPSYLIENLGSTGQDGIRLKTFYSEGNISANDDWYVNTRTHKVFFANPVVDMGVACTFELDTPRLVEVVSSTNPLGQGSFHHTTDLQVGTLGTGFGFPPDNLCSVTTFDPISAMLHQRVSSGLPTVPNFFDLKYDLISKKVIHGAGFGNNPDNLCSILKFDPSVPSLSQTVESNLPAVNGHMFHTDYNLFEGTMDIGFGNNPDNLCMVHTFHNDPPVLQTRIMSALASPDSFFDIFCDLEEASMSQTYQGLTKRDTWVSLESFSSAVHSVSLPDNDITTTYNPSLSSIELNCVRGNHLRDWTPLQMRQVCGSVANPGNDYTSIIDFSGMSIDDSFQDLHHTQSYNPGSGTFGFAVESMGNVVQKIEMKLRTQDRIIQTSVHDLHEIQTFDPEFGIFVVSRESSAPSLSERSFISEYNLTTGESVERMEIPLAGAPHVKRMEGPGPNVKLKYASTDPPLVDKIFEVDYNMATGTIQETYGNLSFKKEIHITSCQQGFHSALLPDNDITINYNLAAGSILTQHKEGTHKETIDVDSWSSRVSSDVLPDDDFEVVYDLADRACTTSFNDLDHSQTFDPAAGTLVNTIVSSNPAMLSCTLGYDLAARSTSESFGTLHCTKTFDPDLHKVVQRFESEDPLIASYDIEYILTQEMMTTHRKHHFQNQFDVDLTEEISRTSRTVTEACTDGTNTLTVARQLDTPIGPTLAIGGNLSIENGSTISSPGGAPLLLTGPVVVDGIQTITGSLDVAGDLNVTGTKNFKIDHPLDPDNKYLIHSCIESPDMMNIYNGNATTDDQGYVTIKLPDYFEALNNDFRYQLTCMGQFAQAIVDQKIKDNTFIIRTDKPNVEVSWQVTGIRHDPASRRNTFAVEVEKEAEMKGKRLYNQ